MDQFEQSCIAKYEDILHKKNVKFFRKDEVDLDKAAKVIIKYAIETLLGWNPVDAAEKMTDKMYRDLRLPYIAQFLRGIPYGINKETDYTAVFSYVFDIKNAPAAEIRRLYDDVKNNRRSSFPPNIFSSIGGKEKLSVLFLDFINGSCDFETIEDLYFKFGDADTMNEILKKERLYNAYRNLYWYPVDALHNALPKDKKDRFLYTAVQFKNVYLQLAAKLHLVSYSKYMVSEDDSSVNLTSAAFENIVRICEEVDIAYASQEKYGFSCLFTQKSDLPTLQEILKYDLEEYLDEFFPFFVYMYKVYTPSEDDKEQQDVCEFIKDFLPDYLKITPVLKMKDMRPLTLEEAQNMPLSLRESCDDWWWTSSESIKDRISVIAYDGSIIDLGMPKTSIGLLKPVIVFSEDTTATVKIPFGARIKIGNYKWTYIGNNMALFEGNLGKYKYSDIPPVIDEFKNRISDRKISVELE